MFVSALLPATATLLLRESVRLASTVTGIVKSIEAPEASVSVWVNVTVMPVATVPEVATEKPLGGVIVPTETPAGNVSVTTTAWPSLGPELTSVIR